MRRPRGSVGEKVYTFQNASEPQTHSALPLSNNKAQCTEFEI